MNSRVVFIGLLCVYSITPSWCYMTQYRKDYVYNKATDAFYKLHVELMLNHNAQNVCKLEGGQLMMVTSEEDIRQAHGMLKGYPDIGNYMYIGHDDQIHGSDEEDPVIDLSEEREHIDTKFTSDGCDALERSGEIVSVPCFRRYPFICKLDAKDAYYDTHCSVYGKQYQYKAVTGSCYRVSELASTWNQALSECNSEGSHLVIINSDAEAEVVRGIADASKKADDAKTPYFFFAGFRAARPVDGSQRVFKTIFNETLSEAGYDKWNDGEPNNYLDEEWCGTIFTGNGKLNDANCIDTYGFVCEKEVHLESTQ